MKQKIHVIIITIIVITMLIVSFVFAINYKNKSVNYFSSSGYIISNLGDGNSNINKLYFEQNTSYKSNNKDGYTFSNSNGEKVEITEESFVHYSDGSIMSLKKGVAIDLNEIDSKLINYYNIFENSVLRKEAAVYKIDNLDKTITFAKLMYKISDNKYLVASPKIIVSFSGEQAVEMEDYVEIEYVSKNVIRIYNDKVNYQTIASNLYIIVDDVKIDLEYKTISKKNVEYLTMADMVINANDNIEVLPQPEEKDESGEENLNNQPNNSENTGNNNSGNSQDNIDSGLQEELGNLVTGLPNENEQLEVEEVKQPVFKVVSMDVTTLGIEYAKFSFTDESAVLYGNRKVELLENSTGRVVQIFDEWEEGNLEYVINSYFSLKPNTEYTLNVTGQYKIDEDVYNRTFISKIFRTLDIGLEIVDDYVTNDSLSFAVYKNSYSDVNGFSYEIIDKNNNTIVKSVDKSFGDSDVVIIEEKDKFDSNTEYVFVMKKIQYGNVAFSTVSYEELKLTHETKTLKENPFKKNNVKLSTNVDETKGVVSFFVQGVNDINGGVNGYIYNIYKSITTENEEPLMHTVSKDSSEPLVLTFQELREIANLSESEDLSNLVIHFNVNINFDDNEKTIIFSSNDSNSVTLGIELPKVVEFESEQNNTDGELISGQIILTDPENFISSDKAFSYQIVIKKNDALVAGEAGPEAIIIAKDIPKDGTNFSIPVYLDGLIPNTEYALYVSLLTTGENVELDTDGDGVIDGVANGSSQSIYLGYTTVRTETAMPVYLVLDNGEKETPSDNPEAVFDINIQKYSEKSGNSDERLGRLEFSLYGCSDGENGNCEDTGYSGTIPDNHDELDKLEHIMAGYEGKLTLYSNDLENAEGLPYTIDNYDSDFKYHVVIKGYSKREYEIPIKVVLPKDEIEEEYEGEYKETDSEIFNIKFNELPPYLSMEKEEIKRDGVTTGFNFKLKSSASTVDAQQYVTKLNYSIVDVTDKTDAYVDEQLNLDYCNDVEYNFENLSSGPNVYSDSLEYDGIKYSRGKKYFLCYYGEYEVDGEIKNTVTQAIDFYGKKKSAEINGYVKDYDGKSVTFKLKIEDEDRALTKICLNTSCKVDLVDEENKYRTEYNFSLDNNDETYSLYAYEKVFETEKEVKMYEFNPDEVIIISDDAEILTVDTTNGGYVRFSIKYTDEDIRGAVTDLFPSKYLDRVVGLYINEHYRKFEKDEQSKELFLDVELTSDVLKIDEDNTLSENNSIMLWFDSGKIVDYTKSSHYWKQAVLGEQTQHSGNIYYNFSGTEDSGRFDNISENSIFAPNSGLPSGTIFEQPGFTVVTENFIGNYLKIGNAVSKLVHSNEVSLWEIELEKKHLQTVEVVLATTEINTIYNSTGATISFDIVNQQINAGTALQVSLKKNGSGIETHKIQCNDDANGCTWESYLSENDENNESGIIKTIKVDEGKKVTIVFDGFDDVSTYSYTISGCTVLGGVEFKTSYNADLKNYNEDLPINSLDRIYINNYSANVVKNKWKWINEFNDIIYTKNLKYKLNVDDETYELKKGEEILYNLILKKGEQNQRMFADAQKLESKSIDKTFDLQSTYSNLEGNYILDLEVKLKKNDGTEKQLKVFNLDDYDGVKKVYKELESKEIEITRDVPKFFVEDTSNPEFKIEIQDEDGMLVACDKKDGNPIEYVGFDKENKDRISKYFNVSEIPKVVYFELFSIAEDNIDGKYIKNFDDKTNVRNLGYSPIPFVNETSGLNLTSQLSNAAVKSYYAVKINYCVKGKDGVQSEVFPKTVDGKQPAYIIYNSTALNMSTLKLANSINLMFREPDEELFNNISEIQYMLTYSTENATYSNSVGGDELSFLSHIDERGKTVYTFEVLNNNNDDGIPVSNVKQMSIKIFFENGSINPISYEKLFN